MKEKILSIVTALIILLSLFPLTHADANTEMGIIPSSTQIEIESTFNITVYLNPGGESVTTWKIYELLFNQTTLGLANATGVWIPGFWGSGFHDKGEIHNDTGNITDIQAFTTGNSTSNETACIVNFTALTVGTIWFNLSSTRIDDENGPVTYHTKNASATIHPKQPATLTATTHNATQIDLTFSPGVGGSIVVIRGSTSGYPSSPQSGTLIYNGTGTSYQHTGLNEGETWYYRAWTYNSTVHLFSINSRQTSATTTSSPPTISNVQDNPDPQDSGNYVNITCTVTDNVAVNTVKVNITDPVGNTTNQTMTHGSGDTYYLNATYLELGTYTYYIWAEDTAGNTAVSTQLTFNITLTKRFYTGWNLITVPINESMMASDLAANITGCEMVSWFDAENQTYRTYIVGVPVYNFSITNGYGVFVYVNQSSNYTFSGDPITNVSVPLYVGYNMIGWYHPASTTASSLADNITGCTIVSSFNASTQTGETYTVGIGGDFTITCGMGIFVHVNQTSTWYGRG